MSKIKLLFLAVWALGPFYRGALGKQPKWRSPSKSGDWYSQY